MSRSPGRVILVGLASLWMLLNSVGYTAQTLSVADLLLKDEIQQAEAVLDKQPRTAQTVALRGEIEFRRGNFNRAAELYKEALRMDAKNARAHFGLAKLAMGKVKGKQAVEEMKRAIELDPKEPLYHLYASEASAIEKNYVEQRKQLEAYLALNPNDPERVVEARAGLEMLKVLGTTDVAVVTAPENPAPIRVRKTLNLIFTQVSINGRGPYNFAVDTGATQTVISEKLIAEMGLQPITSTAVYGIGGAGKVDTKLYGVKEIAVGDVKIKNIPAGTFNDPLVSQLADGILGTAALSDFIITVNYPASQLELSRKRLPATAAAEILPAWYFSNLLLVPLNVNGKQGNFIVDTGAVTTVLSHNMAAQLGINPNTPGAKIDLGIAGVGGFEGIVLKVPNVTFKTAKNTETFPQVVAIDLTQISKMIGTEVGGVAGYDFFSEYKVTLDYYGAEVRLSK